MASKKNKKEKKVLKEEIIEKKEEAIEVVEVKKTETPSKRRNIFIYFLMMIGVFGIINLLSMFISLDLSELATYHRYGDDIIIELFYAILVLIVMLLFKNAYVFTNKKEKLYKALFMASPVLLFSIIILVTNITSVSMSAPEVLTTSNIVSLALLCGLIGITEEFLCRGWLQNEFLERYGDTKKNVIISIIFSSFIFGFMHITNIFSTSQNFFETLLQILNAMSLGFFFGILYYKTKNIWSVIILHAFYDFAIMFGELAIIKECSYGVATSQILLASSLSTAMLSTFWILCSLLIYKRCNFPDQKASLTKMRDFYLIVIPLMVFAFIFAVFPYENIIDDYSDYLICYNYNDLKLEDNYILHYPKYDKFNIRDNSSKSSLELENDEIKEVVRVGNYDFSVLLKNQMPVIRNNITETEVKLSDEPSHDIIVIENEDSFIISFVTLDDNLNEHVYISTFMNKENLSNSDEYLNNVVESFRRLDLPDIDRLGYITIEGKKGNYPAYTTLDHDLFIVLDDELYIVK